MSKNTLQTIINETMYKLIDINKFKTKDIRGLIKNTFNIYCPVCGSDNVHEEVKQLRAGDEEANHIYKCLNCGYLGKDNFLTHPKHVSKKEKGGEVLPEVIEVKDDDANGWEKLEIPIDNQETNNEQLIQEQPEELIEITKKKKSNKKQTEEPPEEQQQQKETTKKKKSTKKQTEELPEEQPLKEPIKKRKSNKKQTDEQIENEIVEKETPKKKSTKKQTEEPHEEQPLKESIKKRKSTKKQTEEQVEKETPKKRKSTRKKIISEESTDNVESIWGF